MGETFKVNLDLFAGYSAGHYLVVVIVVADGLNIKAYLYPDHGALYGPPPPSTHHELPLISVFLSLHHRIAPKRYYTCSSNSFTIP